jgi:hypothetical protein
MQFLHNKPDKLRKSCVIHMIWNWDCFQAIWLEFESEFLSETLTRFPPCFTIHFSLWCMSCNEYKNVPINVAICLTILAINNMLCGQQLKPGSHIPAICWRAIVVNPCFHMTPTSLRLIVGSHWRRKWFQIHARRIWLMSSNHRQWNSPTVGVIWKLDFSSSTK